MAHVSVREGQTYLVRIMLLLQSPCQVARHAPNLNNVIEFNQVVPIRMPHCTHRHRRRRSQYPRLQPMRRARFGPVSTISELSMTDQPTSTSMIPLPAL